MKTAADWEAQARGLIRAELRRRNLSFADLTEKLTAIGVRETPRNIQNKLARGGFEAVFLLQVMDAIGVKNLPLDTGD